MQKRYFEAMAEYVRRGDFDRAEKTDELGDRNAWLIAKTFASLAEQFNPRFDRARFFIACGLEV